MEVKFDELLEGQCRESHSRNERLEDKLKRLELQIEEQRKQIVHLEAIPRMTKAELETPEKEVNKRLFHESGQSSQSQENKPRECTTPPNSHSQNAQGGTDCEAIKETVRRLKFWILQITGALDIEEDPGKVSFPNAKTCWELDRLKKEVEALQEKCKECHSKNPGGDQSKIPVLEKGVDSLKRGLKTIVERLDQFLSHQKRDHAKIQEIQQALDVTRDELAAWAVHLQQQQQTVHCETGETQSAGEETPPTPTTVMTAMARKGDVVIEVTDPDKYQIGKFIVIQESLIYLVEGKGSLILERPSQ